MSQPTCPNCSRDLKTKTRHLCASICSLQDVIKCVWQLERRLRCRVCPVQVGPLVAKTGNHLIPVVLHKKSFVTTSLNNVNLLQVISYEVVTKDIHFCHLLHTQRCVLSSCVACNPNTPCYSIAVLHVWSMGNKWDSFWSPARSKCFSVCAYYYKQNNDFFLHVCNHTIGMFGTDILEKHHLLIQLLC